MLNQETKRKIDSARDILVGKVPDPKAQVEQITTALIYKFMDDMDKEAQELGGKARFFTKGFEKYAWTKLIDAKLGGHDRLDLYIEAITSLSNNPHIPQLFRDIFKDTFLPYRNPETLSLFLKEVNGFSYDNSEDLGNAFEYLLSILGSQGDAGQFRTPRHIIDFIVAAVDPKKEETVCDPACGTAGFLISAYKHILATHDCKDNITGKSTNKEIPLTPDERKNLMNNFAGYDISPDMVRLSKVNLYLHGFPSPTIFEYDTLSSEEKWDESFDVILANPPFMSPKGGIRPHKRFSVQANRSEVLFVDYIIEHLRPNGRAGIIVPEGIIFQSAGAYKQLRKMLVEDGLMAVVSLPAGVFNPYAGVKTSILLFDNEVAKKTKNILFLKIQNDGFGLGAQRREHDKNDLPLALEIIKKYKLAVETQNFASLRLDDKIAHLVAKEKIAETGDYNLSGDRYKEVVGFTNQKWPMVEIGEVCDIEKGTSITKAVINKGDIPVIAGGQQPAYYHNQNNRSGQTITCSASGAYAGFLNYFEIPIFASDCTTIKSKDENNLLTKFVFRYLKVKQDDVYKLQMGMGQPHVYGKDLAKIKIPLLPLSVQKEIVEQIEVKQNAIDHAKAVIQNLERERRYFGQSLRKLEGVELVDLDAIAKTITPPKKIQKVNFNTAGKYPIIDQSQDEIAGWTNDENALVKLNTPAVIFGDHTCAIKYIEESFAQGADGIKILTTDKKLLPKFLYFYLKTGVIKQDGYKRHFSKLKEIKIPLPSLEIQKKLVAEAEKEQQIINANKQLIEIYEQKIKDVLREI